LKLSENKKSLLSELRARMCSVDAEPGVLVERLPYSMGDTIKNSFWTREDNLNSISVTKIEVKLGELLLYLGMEEMNDDEGILFQPGLHFVHKFLYGELVLLFPVTQSSFLRDFMRNVRVVKEKE